jgi:hypothetical protein
MSSEKELVRQHLEEKLENVEARSSPVSWMFLRFRGLTCNPLAARRPLLCRASSHFFTNPDSAQHLCDNVPISLLIAEWMPIGMQDRR